MFKVDEVIRMPHYPTTGKGRFRVWKIVGVHLGGDNQEGCYQLFPLDILPGEPVFVPCVMLEQCPLIERCDELQ